ncbi:hypothetical protein COCCADRAFT_108489 [Bipolaris zeicola 26-R-13]|uniref:Uncharacterized protein n=1 Tax=Cochliobolus carbonum (strain 26-R-13) TaxID=930089 RepID=W6XSR6_COCC2|nr:uncharacterized protein COCCADRAFT_108489 [Bipolaris zeicola 26-R-13]EUC28688.1 hypothetical protein COCCADRAFT_108489 [Bipolaris zeicola 26-R-13]
MQATCQAHLSQFPRSPSSPSSRISHRKTWGRILPPLNSNMTSHTYGIWHRRLVSPRTTHPADIRQVK